MNSRGEPLVRAEGVWKVFGPNGDRLVGTSDADLPRSELYEKTGCTLAVRDVSIEIHPGEMFVVMGLSGSGKSTLARTLIRLIEPSAGTISIAGQDVMAADSGAARAAPAHGLDGLPAFRAARRTARVVDNVAYGLEIQGAPKRGAPARAEQMLSWSGSRTPRITSPTSSRAACSSGWGWRARSRSTRS